MIILSGKGEPQTRTVNNLIVNKYEERREVSIYEITMTAFHGYRKDSFIDTLNEFLIPTIFLTLDHILRCHPFVILSYADSFKGVEVIDVDTKSLKELIRNHMQQINQVHKRKLKYMTVPVVTVVMLKNLFVIDDDLELGSVETELK